MAETIPPLVDIPYMIGLERPKPGWNTDPLVVQVTNVIYRVQLTLED